MLWFNSDALLRSSSNTRISIHLMLWFNDYICILHILPNNFNTSYVVVQPLPTELDLLPFQYFNTSYVVVQRKNAAVTAFFCRISIHLMLWFNPIKIIMTLIQKNFNTSYVVVQRGQHTSVQLAYIYFNTSYVVVQLLRNVLRILILLHFNTSYVVVQLPNTIKPIDSYFNFNTSYVVVQHCPRSNPAF